MLKLVNINKIYKSGDLETQALKDINLEFRKSEFVSILGPSGCGKTTMLNIIGGLDKYTSGDLVINDKSTKEYKDKDWDTYRNHSVGFVFQSYNLIPHETVLENVELALTLSGVSKEERRKRAEKVLTKVGLKDKLRNRPSQLSGGQMQRVAIARALVNDPEIILADEPTGALDTTSSVQIMELLKEISKDKLIIMVTHNPDLATKYSTRIVTLLDGELTGDSNPYDEEKDKNEKQLLSVADDSTLNKTELIKKNKKKRMSFFTALSLSFKNLLTKKGRTILVTFAGSIGIIGIALVLAISSGFNGYVNRMQQDTLSTYPVQVKNTAYDLAGLMKIFFDDETGAGLNNDGKVHTKQELTDMLTKFNASSAVNDLNSFKEYILEDKNMQELKKYASAVQFVYPAKINAYFNSSQNGIVNTNSAEVFEEVIGNYVVTHQEELQNPAKYQKLNYLTMMFGLSSTMSGISFADQFSSEFWSEMIPSEDLIKSQYDIVRGKLATEKDEINIIVDKNNQISDYTLYALGLLDNKKLETLLDNYINANDDTEPVTDTFSFDDVMDLKYKLVLESSYFENTSSDPSKPIYKDIRPTKTESGMYNPVELQSYKQKIPSLYNNGIEVKVVGILREKQDVRAFSLKTNVVYPETLTTYIKDLVNQSDPVKEQLKDENKNYNVLTGQNFSPKESVATTLSTLGFVNDVPTTINIYPKDFNAKEKISNFITNYNNQKLKDNEKDKIITYSDTTGTMISTISTIITSITYVLIAFVGVSLIVSSIMIGIITYISVIERTKEIGVLRSIGASKTDVSRVFTAESFIIGVSSGLTGIIISLLLILPINLILKTFTGIANLAFLPFTGGFILVMISIILTLIAGFFPSIVAAKKDPVIALREN